MTELICCPFCNGSVNYRHFRPDGPGEYELEHHFMCDSCVVLVVLMNVSEQEARAIYNRRPTGERMNDG